MGNTIAALFKKLFDEFKRLFSLHLDTDEAGTVENIKKSIEFKGGNLWGLVFASLIAAIGLNTSSTAVIIGAMLISPLMGPIVGIGYSVGTNDFNTLKVSFRNLLFGGRCEIGTDWPPKPNYGLRLNFEHQNF